MEGQRISSTAEHAGGGPHCLVVVYDYVHDTEPLPLPRGGLAHVPPGIEAMSTHAFRAQLEAMCRTMEPIDWPHLYAWTCGRASIPRRCFLPTFDGGLADHVRQVVPVLQELHLRGVFFVPGRVLTSHQMLPLHALHLLLSILDEATLQRELLHCINARSRVVTDWFSRVDRAQAARLYPTDDPAVAWLKHLLFVALPSELRDAAVKVLFARYIGSMRRWARHWYLGWDDLVDLQGLGHTVGAHGYSHESFPRMTPAQRREDLRRAAGVLDAGLGPDIRPFSFPSGQFDSDTCDACRRSAFVHAFTLDGGFVATGSDVTCLPRVSAAEADSFLSPRVQHAAV